MAKIIETKVINDHLNRSDKLLSEKLSVMDIQNLRDVIDWKSLSGDPRLTENFMHCFSHKLDWKTICKNKKLSLEFIRDHLHPLRNCWDEISRYQTLTEPAMEEFETLINWELVSKYQKMSEDFIQTYYYKVDWHDIELYQNVSKEFIERVKPSSYDLYDCLI